MARGTGCGPAPSEAGSERSEASVRPGRTAGGRSEASSSPGPGRSAGQEVVVPMRPART